MTPSLTARDLRFGGRWRGGQRVKNALLRRCIVLALAIADRLPARVLLAVAGAAGRIAWLCSPTLRRRALAATRLALPKNEARRVAAACFVRAGQNLARCLLLRRSAVRAADLVHLPAESEAVLLDALSAGRGAVVASAHIGPFECIAARVAELGLKPAVVVRESYDPELDPIVDRHRRERGVRVIHRGNGAAGFELVRALRAGRPVGLLPDLGGRGLQTEAAEMLGQMVAFPVGPAQLAARCAAPLLLASLRPDLEANSFILDIQIVTRKAHASLSASLAAAIEAAITSAPEHWLWMAAPVGSPLTPERVIAK